MQLDIMYDYGNSISTKYKVQLLVLSSTTRMVVSESKVIYTHVAFDAYSLQFLYQILSEKVPNYNH